MDLFEMTEGQRTEALERLNFFLKGNHDAMRLCIDMLFVGHLWDDLIDRDKERTPEEINRAFSMAMGEIPSNPFYQAFLPQFLALSMSASFLWQDSNRLEKGGQDEKFMAFILRNALMNLVHFCMFLVGGGEWIKEQGPEFWRYFGKGITGKYEEFLKEKSNGS